MSKIMRFSLYYKVEKVYKYLQLQRDGFNTLIDNQLQRGRYCGRWWQMVADTLYLPHCINNKCVGLGHFT